MKTDKGTLTSRKDFDLLFKEGKRFGGPFFTLLVRKLGDKQEINKTIKTSKTDKTSKTNKTDKISKTSKTDMTSKISKTDKINKATLLRDRSQSKQSNGKIAFIAGKKLGCAVWRNSAKRRLREIALQAELYFDGAHVGIMAKRSLFDKPFSQILKESDRQICAVKEYLKEQ